MRKLMLSELSAVLFFEPEETFLLKGIQRGACSNTNALKLLDCVGINLPTENLYLELFEHDGKSILFITASENTKAGCSIYQFDCADNLIDAVKSIIPQKFENENSDLYEHKGKYYLIIYPPYQFKTAQLLEFGDEASNTCSFVAYLREHGSLLSSPTAITEFTKYF